VNHGISLLLSPSITVHHYPHPVCEEALGPCPDGHCVDALIEHFGGILRDPGQPLRQRNEALKWVVHLVGDLHQPLHSGVARDRGKTPVRSVRGRKLKPDATLHTVWDGELARLALKGWRIPIHGYLRRRREYARFPGGALLRQLHTSCK